MKKRLRVRKDEIIKKTVWLLMILFSAILLFSVYKFVRVLKSYATSAERYRQISEIAVPTALPAPTAFPRAQETETPTEVPVTVDWAALKMANGNVVAWLYCSDTPVNYPVVQAQDNAYYLAHGFDREESKSGALFLDCRNNISAHDENFIIYGHRMKDDSMFGSITEYAKENYYLLHPVMYLLTPEQNYRIDLFACRTVSSEERYFKTYFESKNEFRHYLIKASEQSYWQTNIPIGKDGPVLTLVTCSNYANAESPRLLVHGILVPIDSTLH